MSQQQPAAEGEWVLVPRWKLRRAAEIIERDGDEHAVGRDLSDMLAGTPQPTQPEAAAVPEHVRRLVGKLDQWRFCMSYNGSYFGEPAGLVKRTVEELAHAVSPIYPLKVDKPCS